MSDLTLDVDQAGELKAAFRRGGWTNGDIKHLCEGNILTRVREVILGRATINTGEPTIDLDADPFVPSDWKVEEHRKGGQWKYDPTKLRLHLSVKQQNGQVVTGLELCKELADLPVMNANLLDWYLINPEFIPNELKNQPTFFWGTRYRDPYGNQYVRFLYRRGQKYDWNYSNTRKDWGSTKPGLVLAS